MPVIHRSTRPSASCRARSASPVSGPSSCRRAPGNQVTSVALEKQQVQILGERVAELLDELIQTEEAQTTIPAMTPVGLIDNEPLDQPIEEEFRAGTITLSWDADDERVVIEVFPVVEVEVELPVEAAEQELIDLPDRGARARGGAAGADAGRDGAVLRRPRRVGRGGRSGAVPLLRWPDRRRRPPVPARQRVPPYAWLIAVTVPRALELLDGPAGRARPDHARLEPHLPDPAGRQRRPVRLQAELGGASAVGLHRRHPRGPRVRRLGGLRPPRLGRRTADGAA